MSRVKKKNKWLDGLMPFFIAVVPPDARMSYVKSEDYPKAYYDILSDEKIVLDRQHSKSYRIIGLCIIGFGLLPLILPILKGNDRFIAFSVIALIGLVHVVYSYLAPRKELVFDRKTGLFSFPDWFFLSDHTVPFPKARVIWTGTGGASGALSMTLQVTPPNSSRAIRISCHSADFDGSWSFMVWYMDKNRPLPPGTAFDPYRQLDFERRKAEGFPPPLYISNIPTPEATPKQQKEREKYWKETFYEEDGQLMKRTTRLVDE